MTDADGADHPPDDFHFEKTTVPYDVDAGEPELSSAEVADIYAHAPDEVIRDYESRQPTARDLAIMAAQVDDPRDQDGSTIEGVVVGRQFAGIPIATIRDIKPYVNTLIYGLPGSGKTHLAATGAQSRHLDPMIYINAEAGANTLMKFKEDIDVIPDPETQSGIRWEQFEAIYDELDRQCYNSTDSPDYRTVVVDTGTELQKINMDWIMLRTLSAHPDRDPDVPGLHDWGASTNRMRRYLRLLRDLPMNFILLCHESTERDNKGIQWKRPDLPGKMANQVAGLFDQVMYLYTKEVAAGDETKPTEIVRFLLTGALEGYVTKDRSGNLPLVVQAPNMNDIFEQIHK
jgi:hypothetical protein